MQSLINYREKRDIFFDAPSHTYTDERGNAYTSATTVIGEYKKPFDSEYWLMWSALKKNGYKLIYKEENPAQHLITIRRGRTPKTYRLQYLYTNAEKILNLSTDAVREEWAETTRVACDKGNEKHDFLEDEINKFSATASIKLDGLKKASSDSTFGGSVLNRSALDKSAIRTRHPEIYKVLISYLDAGWTIHAEKRVYSAYHLVAGMIDVLLTKGSNFVILDWKTNKKQLHFESGYYKKVGGIETNEWIKKDDRMLAPINNVADCKGMVYTLQLSLYAYILELWGFKCMGLLLCHIRDIPGQEKVEIKDKKYNTKFYDIKYLKGDIHRMINHHVKNR